MKIIGQLMTDSNLVVNLNNHYIANLYNTKGNAINPLPSKKIVEDYYHSKGKTKENLKVKIIEAFNEKRDKLNKIYSQELNKFEMEMSVEVINFKRGEVLAFKFKSMNSLSQSFKPIRSKVCKLMCLLMLIKLNLRKKLKRIRENIDNKRRGIILGLPLLEALKNPLKNKAPMVNYKNPLNQLENIFSKGANCTKVILNMKDFTNQKFYCQKVMNLDYQKLLEKEESSSEKMTEKSKSKMEGSITSGTSVKSANTKSIVLGSLDIPYTPPSFKMVKFFFIILTCITIIAAEALLVYQTIFYSQLKNTLLAQQLIQQYQYNVLKLTHTSTFMYLMDNKYSSLALTTKNQIKVSSLAQLKGSKETAIKNLNGLTDHKESLTRQFNGQK